MAEKIDPHLVKVYETVKKAFDLRRFNKMNYFTAYPKQLAFFALPEDEVLLMAGNQQGKSEAGAFAAVCHLTGKYPVWWPQTAHRIDHPCRAWLSGESALAVRDIIQKKLIGPPGVPSEFGTGYIPRDDLLDFSLARGVTDAMDTIQVQHYHSDGHGGWIKDGISTATFKSYEQGRQKWQGEPVDFVWFDEEPPADIYSEGIARFTATHGFSFMTFTPLKGMSTVVLRFTEPEKPDPDTGLMPETSRNYITMTLDDALHIKPEERAKIAAKYQPWEREARIKGIPLLGSGRIFLTPESALMEPALEHIPPHWFKLWGVDFGIGHPFAAVVLLWDKDNDVIHVHHCIRMTDTLPLQHAAAMRPVGKALPVVWPQDGTGRGKGDGAPLHTLYRKEGLLMMEGPAMWPEGGNSTEAGVLEMDQRMQTGRFKVASHLTEWFEEYRLYHRDKGVIVKFKDDLLSATRIGIMAKRFGRQVNLGDRPTRKRGGEEGVASDVEFDYFS